MSEDSLKEIASILREILKWTKFAGSKEVKNVLKDALDTDQKLLVYHLSDGDKGSAEIGKKAGVSHSTVFNYWAAWARLDIVEPVKVRGGERYKKVFELEDFGFVIPEIDVKKEAKATGEKKGENDLG
jgi:hypothetical protein